jgi:hypothetical protein
MDSNQKMSAQIIAIYRHLMALLQLLTTTTHTCLQMMRERCVRKRKGTTTHTCAWWRTTHNTETATYHCISLFALVTRFQEVREPDFSLQEKGLLHRIQLASICLELVTMAEASSFEEKVLLAYQTLPFFLSSTCNIFMIFVRFVTKKRTFLRVDQLPAICPCSTEWLCLCFTLPIGPEALSWQLGQ